MKLGYYTIGTQLLFLAMKGLGLASAVTWGWVFAPAFFHIGAWTILYLQYREKQRFLEAFIREFGINPEEGIAFKIPVEEVQDDDDTTVH